MNLFLRKDGEVLLDINFNCGMEEVEIQSLRYHPIDVTDSCCSSYMEYKMNGKYNGQPNDSYDL